MHAPRGFVPVRAAGRCHGQQALTAAAILVAGSTGDCLGADRPSDIFSLACEYARGEHDGSAMNDMATSAHPLSWGRVNVGDISLAADSLFLAARASRTPEQHAIVLGIAGADHPQPARRDRPQRSRPRPGRTAGPGGSAGPRVRSGAVRLPLRIPELSRRPPLGTGLRTRRSTRGHSPSWHPARRKSDTGRPPGTRQQYLPYLPFRRGTPANRALPGNANDIDAPVVHRTAFRQRE